MRFKIRGVSVRIGFLFSAAAVFTLAYDRSMIALYSLAAAAIHEAAHLCCLIYYKERPAALDFSLFGVKMLRSGKIRLGYRQEIFAALSGPLANIILFVFLYAIFIFFNDPDFLGPAIVNLGVGAFNLLPAGDLDGGRILSSIICLRHMPQTAERTVFALSVLTVFIAFFFGFYMLFKSGYNISLLLLAAYICFMTVLRV